MNRIYSFGFDGQHQAEAAVVTCVDFRFHQLVIRFVQEYLAGTFDLLTIPGGGKKFAAGETYAGEVAKAIETVCRPLHHIKKLIIISHWDCGAYGSSAAFSSPEEEEKAYRTDLTIAREMLRQRFRDLEILIGYVKVRGLLAEFVMID
ncbi:MAG: hypothetical protein NTZ18_03420 [Candidatus Komeilibacteria bacterium]|nr:hypothetical protein [Candidatus Komeilibacteria bacterium]